MTAFAVIQAMVIGIVVALSAWQVWRKMLPLTSRRVQSAVARWLDRPGRHAVMRTLGRWCQPAEARSGGCGTGDGCSTCGGCAPVKPSTEQAMEADCEPQPLHFRQRG